MVKFVTHDAIRAGIFNRDGCFTSGTMAGWESLLVNSHPILNLLLDRMNSDYAALNAKMRKAWGAKELDSWIQLDLFFFNATCHIIFGAFFDTNFLGASEEWSQIGAILELMLGISCHIWSLKARTRTQHIKINLWMGRGLFKLIYISWVRARALARARAVKAIKF